LQQQGVILGGEEQPDEAARADTADADRFDGDIYGLTSHFPDDPG